MPSKRLFALLLVQSSAWASLVVDSSSRGWVTDNTSITNNGSQSVNNYFAGYEQTVGAFRDWFVFSIPTFGGMKLSSAALTLDEPSLTQAPNFIPGHIGGPLTYSVYGLSGEPFTFTDVTIANPFGSVATSNSDNGNTVMIDLNSAALAAIADDQGQSIFIGGIDSGETLTSAASGDFSGTQGEGVVSLTLNLQGATAVPEPSTILLVFAAFIFLVHFSRYRHSHHIRK